VENMCNLQKAKHQKYNILYLSVISHPIMHLNGYHSLISIHWYSSIHFKNSTKRFSEYFKVTRIFVNGIAYKILIHVYH